MAVTKKFSKGRMSRSFLHFPPQLCFPPSFFLCLSLVFLCLFLFFLCLTLAFLRLSP
ncbi:uncharacterized protein BDW43DRAFT_294606 [Aspergillus alliaceus]|uniref:uncharacterized protein n=1 Tax=Petromyces alliaceus TaxID=209559 RepID=UPI0012A761BD|nr:uncharacterized protein BDW43DRAFT_294606 [Aspergillus alliaceus]KAB8227256.1 hypothetical protein BDW43DRAFT_294606 [Aspergillus alliaceus]